MQEIRRPIRSVAFLVVMLLSLWGWAAPAGATPTLLVDMDNGEVLSAQDAGLPWHPASLTKLMTALVAFNAIDNGRVGLDTPVIMSARALQAPPSKTGFARDTAVTLEDALNLLIVKSANDIAVAIAETVSGSVEAFAGEMNETAAVLGMTATHYVNPHGLHDPAQVTSARDLALLTLAIQRHFGQYMPIFGTSTVRVGEARYEGHNDLLTQFRGTTGMKTGYVCAAGLNIVATVERDGRRLMAIVLGASSGRERSERAAQMVLDALQGRVRPTGRHVTNIANAAGAAPVDMRPNLCGSEARAYVDAQAAAFPYGLDGEPSFLTDDITARIHRMVTLGRVREVPLPRPRPHSAPLLRAQAEPIAVVAGDYTPPAGLPVPLPRPRPDF